MSKRNKRTNTESGGAKWKRVQADKQTASEAFHKVANTRPQTEEALISRQSKERTFLQAQHGEKVVSSEYAYQLDEEEAHPQLGKVAAQAKGKLEAAAELKRQAKAAGREAARSIAMAGQQWEQMNAKRRAEGLPTLLFPAAGAPSTGQAIARIEERLAGPPPPPVPPHRIQELDNEIKRRKAGVELRLREQEDAAKRQARREQVERKHQKAHAKAVAEAQRQAAQEQAQRKAEQEELIKSYDARQTHPPVAADPGTPSRVEGGHARA